MNDLSPFSPPQPVRTPLPTHEALPIAAGVGIPMLAVFAYDLTVRSAGAGLAIGALAGVGITILLRNTRPTVTSCLGGGGIIGAVAGVAWWTLLDPARSIGECALLGALGGAALLAVELFRRARDENR